MGLLIALETEDGHRLETLEDPQNVFHQLVPDDQPKYEWLSTVDWYGDTVFNYLQAQRVLVEIDQLLARALPEHLQFLRTLRAMIEKCANERHLYVTFYGD